MEPFQLETRRLILGAPRLADESLMTEYCQDPAFERFMTLPWPYLASDARFFVTEYVPKGWTGGSELTWALRARSGGEFLGIVGFRIPSRDLGFWLGAPHRGNGYMPEAVTAVANWVLGTRFAGISKIRWECVVGNYASAAVARNCGFTFTGTAASTIAARDGSHPESWHGSLSATDGRLPKPGWPSQST